MATRKTPFNNALHQIAHQNGPYWVAAVMNVLQRRNGITSFHYALTVTPSGDVCGAGQAYRGSMGDLPPADMSNRALVLA